MLLPLKGRLEEGIAAFPEELARRLILLFPHVGETMLDPYLGSGATMRGARLLGRSCIGYEIDLELLPIIRAKVGMENASLVDDARLKSSSATMPSTCAHGFPSKSVKGGEQQN